MLVVMPCAARVTLEFSGVISDKAEEVFSFAVHNRLVAHHQKTKQIAATLISMLNLVRTGSSSMRNMPVVTIGSGTAWNSADNRVCTPVLARIFHRLNTVRSRSFQKAI